MNSNHHLFDCHPKLFRWCLTHLFVKRRKLERPKILHQILSLNPVTNTICLQAALKIRTMQAHLANRGVLHSHQSLLRQRKSKNKMSQSLSQILLKMTLSDLVSVAKLQVPYNASKDLWRTLVDQSVVRLANYLEAALVVMVAVAQISKRSIQIRIKINRNNKKMPEKFQLRKKMKIWLF